MKRDLTFENAPVSEAGFTLLEMLVSISLFLIVTGSVWGLMRVGLQARATTNQQVDLARNVRIALNLIGRDAYNAGYGYPLTSTVILPDGRLSTLLGIPGDPDSNRDTIPPIVAGNELNADTYATTAGTKTDQVTMMFKDTAFNLVGGVSQPVNINAATTNGSNIDEVVPISSSNTCCRVNDLLLVVGNTGSTLGVVTALSGTTKLQFANGDSMGLNLTGSTGPLRAMTVPASIQRVRMVTYFVTSDGTLTRREYGNNGTTTAYIDAPLVYSVDGFQIRYVMDDGSLTDNPSAGPDGIAGTADDTAANLMAVRQIRFTVSVRSTELNSSGQPYRESMTATYSTRNLGYEVN